MSEVSLKCWFQARRTIWTRSHGYLNVRLREPFGGKQYVKLCSDSQGCFSLAERGPLVDELVSLSRVRGTSKAMASMFLDGMMSQIGRGAREDFVFWFARFGKAKGVNFIGLLELIWRKRRKPKVCQKGAHLA